MALVLHVLASIMVLATAQVRQSPSEKQKQPHHIRWFRVQIYRVNCTVSNYYNSSDGDWDFEKMLHNTCESFK